VRRSSLFSVRVQAARHSTLLICVPRSQKPMQACRVSPPPPGTLGADSLGLALAAAADAVRSVRAGPPLDSIVWAGGGDNGATAGVCGAGVAMADGGNAAVGMDVFWVAAAAAAADAAAAVWDCDGGCGPVRLPPGATATGIGTRGAEAWDAGIPI
jgi:hypothetical protein